MSVECECVWWGRYLDVNRKPPKDVLMRWVSRQAMLDAWAWFSGMLNATPTSLVISFNKSYPTTGRWACMFRFACYYGLAIFTDLFKTNVIFLKGLQLGVVTEKLGVVTKFSVVTTFLTTLNL